MTRYVLASIDIGDNTELRLLANYRADVAMIEISDFTPSSTTVTLDREEAAMLHVALTAFLLRRPDGRGVNDEPCVCDTDFTCVADEHGQDAAATDWHCICGSGDDGEWHSLMCVASNTPDDEWYGEPADPAKS